MMEHDLERGECIILEIFSFEEGCGDGPCKMADDHASVSGQTLQKRLFFRPF